MRRYFFHVLAFCAGTVSGVVASFIVLLIANFGLHRLPRALSFFLHSVNKEVIKGCACFLILAVIIYTACALVQKVTGKLRLNCRYIISAIAGASYPLFVTAAFLTIARFGLSRRLTGTVMGAVLSSICIVGFVARRFTSEIEPGLGFCHSCGYNLRLLDANQCPECGEQIVRSVLVEAVHSERDLEQLEHSRFAIVYLQRPQDWLEEDAWVSFVRELRKNVQKNPEADVFAIDVTQPLIKQWLERPSRGQQIESTDQVAFMARGVILHSTLILLAHYYFRNAAHAVAALNMGL